MLGTKEKEILIGLIVLLIFLFAFIFVWNYLGLKSVDYGEFNSGVRESSDPNARSVAPGVAFADFPSGFPLEKGVQSTDSYRYIPSENPSVRQSTLIYISNLSMEGNQEIFEKYFSDNDYEIINEEKSEDLTFYYAEKDGKILSVTVKHEKGAIVVNNTFTVNNQ